MKIRPSFELTALLALTLYIPADAQELDPVKWSLQIPARAAQESSFVAQLKAEIMPGWHLYAMEQSAGGPRSLRITLPGAQTRELESVRAPTPQVEHDANFDAQTRYYEDAAIFELRIIEHTGAVPSKLTAEVRYQVCSRQLCLPPTTVRLEAGN